MAKAPKPGIGKQLSAEDAARRVMSITVSGETLQFCPDNLPFGERMLVRRNTGQGMESFWGVPGQSIVDLDAFRVLWWLAKRANGDMRYEFAAAIDDVARAFEADDFDIEVTEPDESEEIDNPES